MNSWGGDDENRQIRQRAVAESARRRRDLTRRVEGGQLVLVRTKELPYQDYPPEDQPQSFYPAILIQPQGDPGQGDPVEVEEEAESEYVFGNLSPTWIPPETDVFCWQVGGEFYTIYHEQGGPSGGGSANCQCPEQSYEHEVDCLGCGVMPRYWRITIFGSESENGCEDSVTCNSLMNTPSDLRLTYQGDEYGDSCEWAGRGVNCTHIRLYPGEGDNEDYWMVTIEDDFGCELLTVRKHADDFKCCGTNSGWESVSGECEGFTVSLKPDPCTCCAKSAQTCSPVAGLPLKATITNPEGDHSRFSECHVQGADPGCTLDATCELISPATVSADFCPVGVGGAASRWESDWIETAEAHVTMDYFCNCDHCLGPVIEADCDSNTPTACHSETHRYYWAKFRIDCATDGSMTLRMIDCSFRIPAVGTDGWVRPPKPPILGGGNCSSFSHVAYCVGGAQACCNHPIDPEGQDGDHTIGVECGDPPALDPIGWSYEVGSPGYIINCPLTVTDDDPDSFTASGSCGTVTRA